MGQKVNPVGIRLGITTDWDSTWYAENNYADNLFADLKVREYLEKHLYDAGVAKILIERPAKSAKIRILCARPGVVIGQKGRGVELLRNQVAKIMKLPVNLVHLTIEEVKKPEFDARLVAQTVAAQLEQRVMFRRAIKRAVSSALRAGALGVKICVSGRLGGAEIARTEWHREGRVPLHTFRAVIDYGVAEAHTTFGVIGVKVWIFKGERIGKKIQHVDAANDAQ
ncbi:MAG: 30S ribosomal protein S3 [Gammaproteobacteria bacterium]|nr:30S ribosomal protein S3 [Gammaproteobacteria bacterium]